MLRVAVAVPIITSAWPPTYLVAGEDRDVDSGGDRREEQRRRPGVVEQRDDARARARRRRLPGTSCTSIVSEPGLSSRIARVSLADQLGDAGADQRIVIARRDAEAA